MKLFCSLSLLLFSFTVLSGQSLTEILYADKTFSQITKEADAYFAQKHPGKSAKDLSQGEHRDGEYVKYQRWKHYWSYNQSTTGKVSNNTEYYIRKSRRISTQRDTGPFSDVPWSNISNKSDLGMQIGLGRTTSIAFHPTNPNVFYVGAAIGGIWKTTNGGQSYIPLGDELPSLSVSSIVVDQFNPNNIYIAISDHVWYGPPALGIYKSTDSGNSWEPTALSLNLTENKRIYKILAHPTLPKTMLIATEKGLYKTVDGFQHVTMINNINTYDLAFKTDDPSVVFQISSSGEFLKSDDTGNTFSSITNHAGTGNVVRIATTPQNPNLLYISKGDRLYRSLDAGSTFSFVSTLDNSNPILVVDPQNSDVLVHGNFEVFRSNDGGNSFIQVMDWLGAGGLPLIHVDQRNAFINPLAPRLIYICNDGGVYTFNLDDNTFENLSNGLEITQYYDISVSQSSREIISGGSQDNGSMYRKSDGTWAYFAGTGDGMHTEIDPSNSSIRYWSYQNGALRRWQNGSNSTISPPGEDFEGAWETPYTLDPNNPRRIIAGYKKIYVSNNRGFTWAAIGDELEPGRTLGQVAVAPSNSSIIYATREKDLFVKRNFNNTWEKKATPAPFKISDLEVDPVDYNTLYISVSGYSAGNKVFKSTDAGSTWTNISGDLPNVPAMSLKAFHSVNGGLFVGTDAGVFYQDEIFTEWETYGSLPNTRIKDIEIQYAAALVRVGTHGRGIYEAALPGSETDCNEMMVSFINSGLFSIDVFWDNNGNLVSYGSIQIGQTLQQQTYPGHRWIFKVGDIVVGSYIAVCGINEYTISRCGFRPDTPCPTKLSIKMMLEGPYDPSNGLMKDELRLNDELGTTDPYGFGATMNIDLKDVSGNNSIVEWVSVELRSGIDPNRIIASQPGIIQRDGDVLNPEGKLALDFPEVPRGAYYIIVNYRNHLSLSTATAITLEGVESLDFTDPNFKVFGDEDAGKIVNGQRLMLAGDANEDGTINAVDKNDRWRTENGRPYEYPTSSADFNLDGRVNAVDKNEYWQLNNSKIVRLPQSN